MQGVNPDTAQPSPLAARLGLIFTLLAVLGLFLFPYGTLSRTPDAQALLQRFPAGLVNFTGSEYQNIPSVAPALTVGWVTLAALALSVFAALRRASWLWIAGLITLLSALLAAYLFRHALDSATATLVAQGVRLRRIPWTSGGVHLGLFLPILAGVVTTFAGLSRKTFWWNALNRLRGLLVPLVAIALAIAVGALVVIMVQGVPNGLQHPLSLGELLTGKLDLVWYVYTTLFAPVTNLAGLFDSLKIATPLIFTGLGVALAFRAGLFNIGGAGQLTMGGIAAMLVGVYAPLPHALLLPATILAAAAGGALWGAIPGFLKARFGSNEVINTIMLNYVASAAFVFLIGSDSYSFLGKTYPLPFKAPGNDAKSLDFQDGARLASLADWLSFSRGEQLYLSLGPVLALLTFGALYYGLARLRARTWVAAAAAALVGFASWHLGVPVASSFTESRLNTSFVLALVCAVLVGFLLWRTAAGYALRAVGLSPAAAQYGGISVPKNIILAMTLSGALMGLGATHYTMGGALDDYSLRDNMPVGVGFDGVTVALMGQSTPVGVVASSLLFGTVDTGGVTVDRVLDNVNKDIVTVLKALIVLFIAAGGFLSRRITDPPPPVLLAESNGANPTVTHTPVPNVAASSQQSGEVATHSLEATPKGDAQADPHDQVKEGGQP